MDDVTTTNTTEPDTEPGPSGPCRIGELARRHGLSVEALRYYEQEGLLSPRRDAAGRRVYDAGDQLAVPVITALRGAGFGVRDVAALIAAKQPGLGPDDRVDAAQKRIAAMRQTLKGRRAVLERADALLDDWQAEIDAFRAAGVACQKFLGASRPHGTHLAALPSLAGRPSTASLRRLAMHTP